MKSFKFHDATFVKLTNGFNNEHYIYYHQFIPMEVLYFISNDERDNLSYGIVSKITLLKRTDGDTFAVFYFASDLDYDLREKGIFFTKDYNIFEARLKKIKILK